MYYINAIVPAMFCSLDKGVKDASASHDTSANDCQFFFVGKEKG